MRMNSPLFFFLSPSSPLVCLEKEKKMKFVAIVLVVLIGFSSLSNVNAYPHGGGGGGYHGGGYHGGGGYYGGGGRYRYAPGYPVGLGAAFLGGALASSLFNSYNRAPVVQESPIIVVSGPGQCPPSTPLYFNGGCYAYCPPGTYNTNNVCV